MNCATCGKEFENDTGKRKYCSRKCICAHLKVVNKKWHGVCPNHPDRPIVSNGVCKVCAEASRIKNDPAAHARRLKQQKLYRDSVPSDVLYFRVTKCRYGLSKEDYLAMLLEQDGKCFICRNPPGSGLRLDIDHSHSSGIVRRLLCRRCNQIVGYLEKAGQHTWERMVSYVQGHKEDRLGHVELGSSGPRLVS